jgi:hypothetical protein
MYDFEMIRSNVAVKRATSIQAEMVSKDKIFAMTHQTITMLVMHQ